MHYITIPAFGRKKAFCILCAGDETELTFTTEQLQDLNYKELWFVRNWFIEHHKEIATIEYAWEYAKYQDEFDELKRIQSESDDIWIQQRAKERWDKIVAIKTEQVQQEPEPEMQEDEKDKPGWVYVVGSKEMGLYKIGMTTREPDERIAQFKPALPFEIETICTIRSAKAWCFEQSLHGAFEDKRTNGEWFELDKEDLDWLKKQEEFSKA